MSSSILNTIKKLLGMTPEYTAYDEDVIVAINATFNVLYQLGVGPAEPFSIEDKNTTWDMYTEDRKTIEMVKEYIFMKVKLIFDPPLNASVLESYKQMVSEYEWRLNVEDDIIRHYVPEEDNHDDGV